MLRGTDLNTGNPVAIKRMIQRGEDPAERERFILEARLIAQLDNPHVVKYIAEGVDNEGCACLVLEWLEGTTLAARQRSAPLGVADACIVVAQVATGLESLHRVGIVHRDIKPANLFLRTEPDGQLHCTILDLGTARAQGDAALTLVGSLVGTPAYMSPEQAKADSHLSPQSDLFSLGLVLFELLAGRRAFEGPPHAVLAQLLLSEFQDIGELIEDLPAIVVDIVGTAMARDPSNRFVSARVMAESLRHACALGLPKQSLAPQTQRIEPGAALALTDNPISRPPSSQSRTPRSLGSAELRVVCALFGSFEHAREPAALQELFCREASLRNAETFKMAGGRCAAVFGVGVSTHEAVVNAAHTGVLLRRELPEGSFVLVTGRVIANSHALSMEAIERAMALIDDPADALLVDDLSASLLSAHFVVEEQGERRLIRGEQLIRPEDPPLLLGHRTPTVGREQELAILLSTLDATLDDSVAKAVIVTAAMGLGKSRLRWEWTERLRTKFAQQDNAPLVLVVLPDPVGASVALGLLAKIVGRAFGISVSDAIPLRREKLCARITSRDFGPEARRIAAFLGELVNAPFDNEWLEQLRPARVDRMLMADQILRAWSDWITMQTAQRGLVIVIDDIHWADSPSIAALEASLALCAEQPLMVVVLGRPEVHEQFPKLFQRHSALEVRLGGLRPKDATRVVSSVLTQANPATVSALVTRADSNPLVLEELIRAAEQSTTDEISPTIFALTEARLQTLPMEARRILRLASVMGTEFWLGALRELLPPEEHQVLEPSLKILGTAEMIVRRKDSRYAGEIQYAFHHGLIRETAYSMMTPEDRVSAHELTAHWLVRVGEPNAFRIAEHFERGGCASLAATYFARTASAAMTRSDLPSVLRFTDKALELGITDAMAGDLWLLRAEAHRWRGENLQAFNAATKAIGLLEQASDSWFQALMEQMQSAGRMSEKANLSAAAKHLLSRESSHVGGAEAMACARGIVQLSHQGYATLAETLMQRLQHAIETEAPVWDRRVRGAIKVAQGRLSLAQGEVGLFVQSMTEAATLFDQAGDLRAASMQRVNVGYAHSKSGAYTTSEQVLREALESAFRLGLRDVEVMARSNLALVLGYLGRADEAEVEGELAVEGYRAQGATFLLSPTLLYIANAKLLQNDYSSALAYAENALAEALGATSRASTLGMLSRIRVATGQPEAGLEAARQAMGILELLGTIADFDLLIWLGFIESLLACQLFDEAEDALRGARELVQKRVSNLGIELDPHDDSCALYELKALLNLAEQHLRDTDPG